MFESWNGFFFFDFFVVMSFVSETPCDCPYNSSTFKDKFHISNTLHLIHKYFILFLSEKYGIHVL